jgi:hypothetical protein
MDSFDVFLRFTRMLRDRTATVISTPCVGCDGCGPKD